MNNILESYIVTVGTGLRDIKESAKKKTKVKLQMINTKNFELQTLHQNQELQQQQKQFPHRQTQWENLQQQHEQQQQHKKATWKGLKHQET